MPKRKPWEVHSDLGEDRLKTVARLLAEVRNEARDEYDPEKGDGPWNLGCTAFSRSCSRLIQASDGFEWLSIVDPRFRFVFSIGKVPVRFYHGVAVSPRSNLLVRSDLELLWEQEVMEFVDEWEQGWRWVVAVETDAEGYVAQVVIVQVNELKETRNAWSIPYEGTVSVLASLGKVKAPVKLPPAAVGLPADDEAADEDAGES